MALGESGSTASEPSRAAAQEGAGGTAASQNGTRALLGVVMAGGRSSRMGRDKGLEPFHGRAMALRVWDLLRAQGLSVVFSVNASQVAEYEQLLASEHQHHLLEHQRLASEHQHQAPPLIVDDDLGEFRGPLRGILSIHAAYPKHDLFVIACDMPLLADDVLHRLHAAWREDVEAHDYVAFDVDGIQPLCAVYRAEALRGLLARVVAADLPPFCPRKLMGSARTLLLYAGGQGESRQFANVNRPEELAAAISATHDDSFS